MKRGRVRMLGIMLIGIGLALMCVGYAQRGGVEVRASPVPTLFADVIRVKLGEGPAYLLEAFRRAVDDWSDGVRAFNGFVKPWVSCRASKPLPYIRVVDDGAFDVYVLFSDWVPGEDAVAYTAFIGEVAEVVVWSSVPEHRAYQVAIHEVSRLYGLETTRIYKTLFGAIPASVDTSLLHSSPGEFMGGGPDPLAPTSAELYAAYMALNAHAPYASANPPVAFVALGREPDFTYPALASPAFVTLGAYLLSRGRGA